MSRESWSLGSILALIICFVVGYFVLSALRRAFKKPGTSQNGLFVTVYEWEHALLYVNGRFTRLLPPGRHWLLGWNRRDVFKLSRRENILSTGFIDVTSADKLLFRISASLVYEVADPQQAFEAGDCEVHIRLAAMLVLTRLAADHTLATLLAERDALDEKLLALVSSPVAGCTIRRIMVATVTLPPELRRLFTEVERAKLEGLATLERARGEHAALRSLANAARMLKGNPELMNLRVLQALPAGTGKRPPTLVLGQGSLLPIGSEAASSDE